MYATRGQQVEKRKDNSPLLWIWGGDLFRYRLIQWCLISISTPSVLYFQISSLFSSVPSLWSPRWSLRTATADLPSFAGSQAVQFRLASAPTFFAGCHWTSLKMAEHSRIPSCPTELLPSPIDLLWAARTTSVTRLQAGTGPPPQVRLSSCLGSPLLLRPDLTGPPDTHWPVKEK